jgi:hypothetical protein
MERRTVRRNKELDDANPRAVGVRVFGPAAFPGSEVLSDMRADLVTFPAVKFHRSTGTWWLVAVMIVALVPACNAPSTPTPTPPPSPPSLPVDPANVVSLPAPAAVPFSTTDPIVGRYTLEIVAGSASGPRCGAVPDYAKRRSATRPAFTGGVAVGQWRPTPPAFGPMSAQGLAFTEMFVLDSNTQFRPEPPRILTDITYSDDFNAAKALGRRTGSTRTDDQTALAPFWEGNASVHWNQAANQIARSNHVSMSRSNRLLAVLNIAMADTAFTIWSAKRFYGSLPTEVTWRPVTAIPLADTDGNPETAPDADWLPLVNTPSHPEYPAGHPSLNGAAGTVLLSHFDDRQTFTLTTTGQPDRIYASIAQAWADGNDARVWGGMHYPSTVAISDAVGKAIARYVNRNAMQRLRGKERK